MIDDRFGFEVSSEVYLKLVETKKNLKPVIRPEEEVERIIEL